MHVYKVVKVIKSTRLGSPNTDLIVKFGNFFFDISEERLKRKQRLT